jgi:hypothetical protein
MCIRADGGPRGQYQGDAIVCESVAGDLAPTAIAGLGHEVAQWLFDHQGQEVTITINMWDNSK